MNKKTVIECTSIPDLIKESMVHLVKLASRGHFQGSGGGGVFDTHEPGHHALHGRPVKAAVGIPVLEVHAWRAHAASGSQ